MTRHDAASRKEARRTSKPHSSDTSSLLLREQGTGKRRVHSNESSIFVRSRICHELESSEGSVHPSIDRGRRGAHRVEQRRQREHQHSLGARRGGRDLPAQRRLVCSVDCSGSCLVCYCWVRPCASMCVCVYVRPSFSGLHCKRQHRITVTIAFTHVSFLSQSFSPSAIVFYSVFFSLRAGHKTGAITSGTKTLCEM